MIVIIDVKRVAPSKTVPSAFIEIALSARVNSISEFSAVTCMLGLEISPLLPLKVKLIFPSFTKRSEIEPLTCPNKRSCFGRANTQS